MRKVRFSIGLMLATAAACAAILISPMVRMSSVPTETPAKVTLTEVTQGEIRQLVAVRGAVRYAQEYAAIAPVTGIVADVYVRPGDHVVKGQALMRMDSSAEEAMLSEAYEARAAAVQQGSALPESLQLDQLTEAALQETQARMDAMTLRAAADGQVIDVPVGQYGGLLAGSTAVLLCGAEQKIVCTASLHDAAALEKGMHAAVYVQGEPYCSAWIDHVGAAQTDALTGQIVCPVHLTPEKSIRLPLGATVEVEIDLFTKSDVAVLPITALTPDTTVWIASDNRCWEASVTVYKQDEMHCWVNLPIGTAVIDRPDGLVEGQRIREVSP